MNSRHGLTSVYRCPAVKSSLFCLAGVALAGGCHVPETTDVGESLGSTAQALTEGTESSCGYELTTGNYSTWPGGYQSWVELSNVDGETALDFEVLVDVGDTAIVNGYQAEYAEADGGYSVTAPAWLQWQQIPVGSSYRFAFVGQPSFESVTPYVISINGVTCDELSPEVTLSASQGLFTSDGTLTLTAEASDNVTVRKLVFERDGEVIFEDTEAPYVLEVPVSDELNGRHSYTATAFDATGNQASDEERVLVAIGNRFLGSAVAAAAEYVDYTTYFDQLTPGNAGKWGSVEATRDVMNWADLDTAYQFSKDNGMPFKLHTLVWGSQQPNWIGGLSVEEQLAEVEEWFTALAERYPDVEMIDVVNEPLHAPPPYIEALGGAGETGWDWLITSFEMARSHFPDSELILNDYGILIFEPSTADYLEPIQVLQERDLIDGIGVQAHFLERAELAVVEANLSALAGTGLPIYVSEFDVNFANDARQAGRFKDLFTIFWDNPSVLGVTHWGHLENYIWREDAYLIRQDGTPRPALDWLMCFIGGGDDCTVPEYVPEPRIGGEYGIDLEAEEWDEAQGILSAGDFIAYTDPGDFEQFARVNFQENWDTFWVTYAKGNQDLGSVSIHLDSLESDPALVVPLPTTGNWGVFQTLEAAWPAIDGEHDVFIRFNDVYGVGNIDGYRFGTPEPLPDYGPNLVANGDFESGSVGWFSWSGGVVTTSTEYAHSGSSSLAIIDRPGNAPAATSIAAQVTPGTTYDVSLWTTISGASQASVNVTQAITCEGESTQYSWIINPVVVFEGVWTKLSGQLAVPDCNITGLLVYAEGPPAGVNLYLDAVEVHQPLELLSDGGFESGTDGWFSWAGGVVSASSALAHSGAQSLLVSDRPGNAPAARSLAGLVQPGRTYDVSLWASISGAAQTSINVTQAVTCEGEGTQYSWLINPVMVQEGQWVKLSGQLSVPDCPLTGLLVYAEGPPAGVDLHIDEASVRLHIDTGINLLGAGDFEAGSEGWFSWGGGVISTSTDTAHGGSQSLVVTDRPGNAPAAHNLTAAVTPGTTYQVSMWVSISGASEAPVNITRALTCEGEATQYAWIANTGAVLEGEWVELTGQLVVPDCVVTDLLVYVEGPPGGVDLYVDDAVVQE